MKKTKGRGKKREWKLMYLIVLVTAGTVGLTVLITVVSMFFMQSTVVGWILGEALYAASDHLTGDLDEYNSLPWLLDYWESNEGKMSSGQEQAEGEDLIFSLEQVESLLGSSRRATEEQIENLTEEQQRLFAESCYRDIETIFSTYTGTVLQDFSFCFRVEGDGAFLYFADLNDDGKSVTVPSKIPKLDTELLIAVQDAEKRFKETGKHIFYTLADTEYPSFCVIHPVIRDGDTLCFVACSVSLEALAVVMKIAFALVGIPVLVQLVICDVVLLIFIYVKAIRPTEVLQRVVKKYTETRDSGDIQSGLKKLLRKRDEYGRLSTKISDMASSIDQYVGEIERAASEKQRLSTELEMATTIQKSQLPSVFPAFPERKDFDLYASMEPAKEVGGDFYDFFLVDEDHIVLVVGDVSDKGIPAALVMMVTKTLLRSAMLQGMTPSDAMEHVNRQFCKTNAAEMFITVWMAAIDLTTGRGIEINAGHEKPVLKRRGEDFALVRNQHDMALGTWEEQTFTEHPIQLGRGDVIFIYTDGVPEATSKEKELFGTERMLDTLNENTELSLMEQVCHMKESVAAFVGEAEQFDDMTMLGFLWQGNN